MIKIDNAHRAAVAHAWQEARAHGEDQARFCARQVPPIRPRTLRQWVKTCGASARASGPGADFRLIYAALANLQILADMMERAAVPTCRDADAEGVPAAAAASEVGPLVSEGTPDGTPAAQVPEARRPHSASFWDEA